jgi:acetyl-CoA acyltransferase
VPNLQSGEVTVKEYLAENDEGPRSDSSSEGLARLRPVFAARGSVTAGNSSQMSDGAAAVLVVSEKILKQFNLKPLARFAGFSVAGVAPEIMGIGPVERFRGVLKRAGIGQHEVDWIELNEAFAAQALAVIRELNLDPAKVNPLGGAIALGHPLGATGTIRTATLVHGLQRTGQRYGMVTMCIGTGMGAAGLFEVAAVGSLRVSAWASPGFPGGGFFQGSFVRLPARLAGDGQESKFPLERRQVSGIMFAGHGHEGAQWIWSYWAVSDGAKD